MFGVVLLLTLAQLWHVGGWSIRPAASLNLDHGLRVGQLAPELAVRVGDDLTHVVFTQGETVLLAMGAADCKPCERLVSVAARHPATRRMRRIFVTDNLDGPAVSEGREAGWEVMAFAEEEHARRVWRAAVSPYVHVIGPDGRVLAKGIANASEHLDRLLSIPPTATSGSSTD